MSKFTFLLDAGHGGIVNGQYVTAGKRSPAFNDGRQLYEGVYNRAIVEKIKTKLAPLGIKYLDIVNSNDDVPLGIRVKLANGFYKVEKNCVYISIHANAGPKFEWSEPKGIEVYTSKGQTKSDMFASILIDKMECFVQDVRWRKDISDGDADKEENFYVLKETLMPAILSENGFMTNMGECERMFTEEWQNNIAEAHVQAILEWEKLHR